MAESTRPQLTGEEYMALLRERQAAYLAEHPPATPWLLPLLEWFVQEGDELLFTPPEEIPQPKRATKPQAYRTAASLRVERDRLVARRAPLLEPLAPPDRAACGGQALGRKRTARLQQREDSRIQKYTALTRRIDTLDHRIRLAEARERKSTSTAAPGTSAETPRFGTSAPRTERPTT